MKLTDALLGEHGLFAPLFEALEDVAERRASPELVVATLEPVAAAILSHATLEDEILFPALEAVVGTIAPLVVMRQEHAQIEDLVERVRRATTPDAAAQAVHALLEVTRAHFAKEEQVLFPAIARSVPAARLEELVDDWCRARHVVVA